MVVGDDTRVGRTTMTAYEALKGTILTYLGTGGY